MTARDYLLVYLNGQPLQIFGAEAFLTLSDYLREEKGLTGTKIVCSEGDCGACTVLVGRLTDEGIRYEGIDACIVFMHQLDAAHVVTVEGLCRDGRLHPVQQAMVDCFGSQCGFCTPGFVGAMVAKVESLPPEVAATDVDSESWQQALTGNLCRCTGYVQILEAAAQAATAGAENRIESLYPSTDLLKWLRSAATQTVHLCAPPRFGSQTSRELLLPLTLDEALEFKFQHPEARVVSGATDVGVQSNKGLNAPDVVLSLGKVAGHSAVESITDGARTGDIAVKIGMRATWAEMEQWAKESLPEFYKIIIRFGSPQIRAAGTLVGNVANGSPIGDSLPLLFVMEAELELSSTTGVRSVSVTKFFKGYKVCLCENIQRFLDNRQGQMAIHFGATMTRNMLNHGHNPARTQTRHTGMCHINHMVRTT